MAGPIIGSALYAALGYERMFYVYGGAEVVFALVLRFGIPEIVQEEQSKDVEELTPALRGDGTIRGSNFSYSNISLHGITHSRVSLYSGQGQHISAGQIIDEAKLIGDSTSKKPSYCSLFSIPRYLCALVSPGLLQNHFCAMEPILAQRLMLENLTTMQVGLFFCIMPLTYTIGSLTLQYMPSWIEKRAITCFGFLVVIFCFLCVGPSQFLHFPNSILLMAIGHTIGGFFLSQGCQPALIEMINVSKE